MALDVVGAGFGRTGTLSLKIALEKLGFDRCYHMMEMRRNPEHAPLWAAAHRGDPVDWDALFAGYRATVDWPSCNLWLEQAEHWPDAKVILSTRDPDRWYESVINTIYKMSTAAYRSEEPGVHAMGAWAKEIIWDHVFDGRMDDREHVIGIYRAHAERVIASLPAERLLVFEASQGWEPLCAFLDRPVPDEPYPRVNTTEDFLAGRIEAQAAPGS